MILGAVAAINQKNIKRLIAYSSISHMGFAIAGISTLAWQAGLLDGFAWFIIVGIGLYLAYVPYHSMLFERFIALFREKGNAGYLIYVADATGYLSSVAVLLVKNFAASELTPLDFFVKVTYFVSIAGVVSISVALAYFVIRRAVSRPAIEQPEGPGLFETGQQI